MQPVVAVMNVHLAARLVTTRGVCSLYIYSGHQVIAACGASGDGHFCVCWGRWCCRERVYCPWQAPGLQWEWTTETLAVSWGAH